MSNNYDISVKRGIGYRLYFNYLNENNTPVNLSNTSGLFTVKRYLSSDTPTLICSENGITATFFANDNNQYTVFSETESIRFNVNEQGITGNTGGILIHIPSEMSHYIAEGKYFFNLVLSATGDREELLFGKFDCAENVSEGPILPIVGSTGSTGPKPSIRPFVVSSNYRAYSLQEDDTIVYWGNIQQDNIYSYRSGTISGITSDYIRVTPNGILALLNDRVSPGQTTNLKFVIQDEVIYVGPGISADGMLVPHSENLKKIKDIVLTDNNTLALQEDGTIIVWGINWAPSENENTVADVPLGITFEKLSGGPNHVLGLRSNGTVVAWGNDDDDQCNVPSELSDVVEISAGSNFSLARKSDNTVVCWGGGNNGICDQFPLSENSKYSKISAGDNYYLLLSLGNTLSIIPEDAHPLPANTRKFKNIFAGYDFYVTIEDQNSTGENFRSENTINSFSTDGFSYGIPNTGLTGDFIAITSKITIVGKTGGPISIHYSASDYPNGVLEMNNIPVVSSIAKIATGFDNTAIVLNNTGSIYGWGNNKENLVSIPYQGFTLVKQIEIGKEHAILLDRNNQVRCIGRNDFGQCDVPNNLTNIYSVWAGRNFSGIIKNDGTVLGWGETKNYLNTSSVFYDSILMPKLNASGITGATKISVGFSEIFVLTDRGTITGITGASWAAESNQPGSSYINFFAGNFYTSRGYTSGISLNNIKYMSDQNQNTRYHFAISNSGVIYGWGHNSISPARNEIFGTPTGGAEDIAAGLTFKHVEKGQGLISAINPDNTITVWGEVLGYSLGTLPEGLKSED